MANEALYVDPGIPQDDTAAYVKESGNDSGCLAIGKNRIGVGTTSPGEKLEVKGNIKASTEDITTGTAQCNGNGTVTGTSTHWNSTDQLASEDLIYLSDTQWHIILAVASDTSLTIADNGPTDGSAHSYTARRYGRYTGKKIGSIVFVEPPTGTASTDRQNIQNAIDSLPVGGGSVCLCSGQYTIDSSLTIANPGGISLIGVRNTIIKFTGTGNVLHIGNGTNHFYGFDIQKINFLGSSGNNNKGVLMQLVHRYRIVACSFNQFGEDGIELQGCWGGEIRSCRMYGNSGNGIRLKYVTDKTNSLLIEDCIMDWNKEWGFFADEADLYEIVVNRNIVSCNGLGGIYLDNVNSSRISYNEIEQNDQEAEEDSAFGVYIGENNQCEDILIEGNMINSMNTNGGLGVKIDRSLNAIVRGNYFINNDVGHLEITANATGTLVERNSNYNNIYLVDNGNGTVIIGMSSGFVGIGCATPSRKLEIQGGTSNASDWLGLTCGYGKFDVTPANRVSGSYGDSIKQVFHGKIGDAGAGNRIGSIGWKAEDGNTSPFTKAFLVFSSKADLNLAQAGIDTNAEMVITGGNVGIGCTPDNVLHVYKSGAECDVKCESTNNWACFIAKSGAKQAEFDYNTARLGISVDGMEAITIPNGGSVGIGKTNPSTKLDVDGPIAMKTYTNANRPSASSLAAGTMIYNTNDNAPNFSDGTNWRDAVGNIT